MTRWPSHAATRTLARSQAAVPFGVGVKTATANSVWAITLGALIIVPAIITLWTTPDRLQRTQETAGVDRPASGPVIFILLLLIGPVGVWYAQHELNKAWTAQASAGAAATLPSTGASVQPAPPPPPAPVEPRPEAPEQGPQSPS